MKTSFLLAAVALATNVSAWWGKMESSNYEVIPGGKYAQIILTDYTTGSQYSGSLKGAWNACANGNRCSIHFSQLGTKKGYNFDATMWRTNDGCHNIDFQGALDAHHGYCCGSLPCNFRA